MTKLKPYQISLINSISLKMIASYLGITDVALSRIRSRLAKKGSAN